MAPATQLAGLILGAVTIAAAILAVGRRRELAHLPPLGIFVALLAETAVVRGA